MYLTFSSLRFDLVFNIYVRDICFCFFQLLMYASLGYMHSSNIPSFKPTLCVSQFLYSKLSIPFSKLSIPFHDMTLLFVYTNGMRSARITIAFNLLSVCADITFHLIIFTSIFLTISCAC